MSGLAILGVSGDSPVTISGSSGLIQFAWDDAAHGHHVQPVWRADCAAIAVDSATPMNQALTKSGALSQTDPDAPFLRSFFADPQVHLGARRPVVR